MIEGVEKNLESNAFTFYAYYWCNNRIAKVVDMFPFFSIIFELPCKLGVDVNFRMEQMSFMCSWRVLRSPAPAPRSLSGQAKI